MQPTNENSVGPVIAIIIVLAMVVLGGLYFWGERTNNARLERASESGNVDEITASIEAQSSSDDSSSIQVDLDNTNTETLDSGLGF